jgi:hypothetical protein
MILAVSDLANTRAWRRKLRIAAAMVRALGKVLAVPGVAELGTPVGGVVCDL